MATAASWQASTSPAARFDQLRADSLRATRQKQKEHTYLYWEFYEQGGKQAVRSGKWKAIRIPMFDGKTELFDLDGDLGRSKTTSLTIIRTSSRSWKP